MTEPPDRADPQMPEDFLSLILFEQHRDLAQTWLAAWTPESLPPLDAFGRALQVYSGWLYAWKPTAGGDDLVGLFCGPRIRDFMGLDPTGKPYGFHVPGPMGPGMLANLLECVAHGTPFVVLRRTHPYPQAWAGYESLVVPVQLDDGGPALLGHLLPFAPVSVADLLRPERSIPDRGHRLWMRPPQSDPGSVPKR